ncbi:aminotransferase class I/II-fold pyridoxal phosphate-dependent enzyme [Halalkalibacter urbisdiaboli]|uniref:aminotransferase class I/II-fold pyridoxal phosphate-dependent enzyme n=1 Tax=Halalkalibacter urbisdiaboli TaxID=1960589 RepID=UPI000B454EC1|nr:aminotransferase class I/II-fold pyridoxal phosphate-dependent enzyme [Halalkalibacter urbisdiaboli]
MKQTLAPLVQALQTHVKERPISFHVPGHKNGSFFPEMLYNDFKQALQYDVTELEGLDDLHSPEGPILEAQTLAASFYGAGHTFFLVGGSTVGNLAMVFALCRPGDIVFVQRNAHKSIFHAIKLARVTPIFLTPEYDKETGHPIGIALETLQEALRSYPNAKALLLTFPNYYGVGLNPKQLISVAKEHGLYVLVDEAHGAHFQISNSFPTSTLTLGADVVVQSTHKMLPALTMGSFLHVHSRLRNKVKQLQESLSIFQSSSPSYLIMASLDGARAYAETLDKQRIISILAGVNTFKRELATIKQIEVIKWPQSYQCDPLKVTIKTACELTGYQLQHAFNQVGVYPELADRDHVLFVLGLEELMNIEPIIKKLTSALSSYSVMIKQKNDMSFQGDKVSKLVLSSEELQRYSRTKVSLHQAVGQIAAEAIIPYPPGIPIILPGERIKQEIIKKIQELEQAGAYFQGHSSINEGIFIVELED